MCPLFEEKKEQTRTHTHIHAYTHIHVCTHKLVHACTLTCVHAHTHPPPTHTHTHTVTKTCYWKINDLLVTESFFFFVFFFSFLPFWSVQVLFSIESRKNGFIFFFLFSEEDLPIFASFFQIYLQMFLFSREIKDLLLDVLYFCFCTMVHFCMTVHNCYWCLEA